MVLQRLAVVVTCLACVGWGRRMQSAAETSRSRGAAEHPKLTKLSGTGDGSSHVFDDQSVGSISANSVPNALKTFAKLLQDASPAAAFKPLGPAIRAHPTLGTAHPVVQNTLRNRLPVVMKDGDDEGGGGIVPSFSADDMNLLRSRIQKIQKDGLPTSSEMLVNIATSVSPGQLMQDFFRTASPAVVTAMQEAVASLLGVMPPFDFDSQLTTTGDKLASLMLNLQTTGYMLRNAEYVMTLRRLLQLKTRSTQEYRKAFDRMDIDKDGYIDTKEIEQMLSDVYGKEVPPIEVAAFVKLFDTDGDGRVSWQEFGAALGAVESPTALDMLPPPSSDAEPKPQLIGEVTVTLDDGSEVKMDANAYMEQLKAEALALRAELAKIEKQKQQEQVALSSSISAYVSSLPEAQRDVLTAGITPDVVSAMRQLVSYILKGQQGDTPIDEDVEVTVERARLQELCVYQLVLGYRLREAEAKGIASDAIGK